MKKSPDQAPVPTVAIALMAALMMGGGFFSIVIVVIPGAAQMLFAGLFLVGFFVAQYFVWGRWLYAYVMRQEEIRIAAEAKAAALTEKPSGAGAGFGQQIAP